MKIGMIISQTEPETVFNVLRLANFSIKSGDQVQVFLLGQGVEIESTEDDRFDVYGQAESLLKAGGEILACGTCLKIRNASGSEICPVSTMKDLHELVRDSDRVVTF